MDGEVVHALLRLLLDHFEVQIDIQVLKLLHPRQRLVQRHRPDRHRRMPQNLLADHRNIAARGQVHHRVRAVMHRSMQLPQLFIYIRYHRRIPDVRVDLAQRSHPDRHRLQLWMIDVRGNDHSPHRNLIADKARLDLFHLCHIGHLFGDQPLARKVHLAHVAVAGVAQPRPCASQSTPSAAPEPCSHFPAHSPALHARSHWRDGHFRFHS